MARGKLIGDYLRNMGKKVSPAITKTIENMPETTGTMLGRLGRPASAVGRGIGRIGSSRAGLFGVAAVAGTAGFLSEVAPATQDLALETAFGDANADRYFTGRDLDTRFLVGSMMGGVGGGLLQASAPGDFIATNPTAGAVAIGAGGVAGAAAGGLIGGMMSRGIRGAMIGGAIGTAAGLSNRLNNNMQFYRESPYFSSGQTASNLNATGDIVLGMHNSRRGY